MVTFVVFRLKEYSEELWDSGLLWGLTAGLIPEEEHKDMTILTSLNEQLLPALKSVSFLDC